MNHAITQLQYAYGFADMGEDVQERAHQARVRHEERLTRLRYKTKMVLQAKRQDLSNIKSINDITNEVKQKGRDR